MKQNVLLTIAYDGGAFHGWQRQPGLRTVQGDLEEALSVLCAQPIVLEGTGRTDAGVHALGQCASFQGDFTIPVDRIPRAMTSQLARLQKSGPDDRTMPGQSQVQGNDVQVLSARVVPEGFHARFSCQGKTYRYRIGKGEADPFRRKYLYFVRDALDLSQMREAASYLVGTHDFACFQAAGGNPRETTVRTIYDITITEKQEEIALDVTGDGFLYNMVRILAGTLIQVGQGAVDPGRMPGIVASCDRTQAGPTAPPQGLYLKQIYFDDTFQKHRGGTTP